MKLNFELRGWKLKLYYISPIGVLTPFLPLHFRVEVQEDVSRHAIIMEAQIIGFTQILAGW